MTLSPESGAAAGERLNLLEQRAGTQDPLPECDLISRGVIDGLRYSGLFAGDSYQSAGGEHSSNWLRDAASAEGNVLTFTCVPPGSGSRLALDNGD